jgi:glycosyltransferase involved in cell wall biosynthesis
MKSDKISVIVPIYNVERLLCRCIESIRKQTYKNLEIILVDDGSPDNSGDICEDYADKDRRIKVIHKCNGGLSDARNIGIEFASGEYICFVDSDDWLDLDMLELLHKVCVDRKADIVECSYRNVYADYIQEETCCTAEIIEADSIFALEGMLDWKYFKPVAWNKLYKKSVLGDIRYPLGKIHEDEFTTYKYFYNANKLVYVDVSKYNYDRTRNDSITGTGFKESTLDACFAFRERVDFFKEHHINTLERKMNDIYCYQVLHYSYQCYLAKITGEKVDRLIESVNKDIAYLEQADVNEQYVKEFKILKDGIERYGEYRDNRENG